MVVTQNPPSFRWGRWLGKDVDLLLGDVELKEGKPQSTDGGEGFDGGEVSSIGAVEAGLVEVAAVEGEVAEADGVG